jgi:hypothetical protein
MHMVISGDNRRSQRPSIFLELSLSEDALKLWGQGLRHAMGHYDLYKHDDADFRKSYLMADQGRAVRHFRKCSDRFSPPLVTQLGVLCE